MWRDGQGLGHEEIMGHAMEVSWKNWEDFEVCHEFR